MSNGGLPRPSLASSASPGINSSGGSRFNESILAQDDAQDTPKSRQRVQNDTRYEIIVSVKSYAPQKDIKTVLTILYLFETRTPLTLN